MSTHADDGLEHTSEQRHILVSLGQDLEQILVRLELIAGPSKVSTDKPSRTTISVLLKLAADLVHQVEDIVKVWRSLLPEGSVCARHLVSELGPGETQLYSCGTQYELFLLAASISATTRSKL